MLEIVDRQSDKVKPMAGIKHWIGLAAVLACVAMPAGAVNVPDVVYEPEPA